MLKGNVTIPVVKVKVPKLAIGAIGIAAIGYFVMKGKIGAGGALRLVEQADIAKGVINPTQVRPNSFITVTGNFQDKNGKPVKVKRAYYYVYEHDTYQGKQLVGSGIIGDNIGTFNKVIPTTNFRQSRHSVIIRDSPVDQSQLLGQLNVGPGPVGTGGRSIGPNQSTTIPGSTGITSS